MHSMCFSAEAKQAQDKMMLMLEEILQCLHSAESTFSITSRNVFGQKLVFYDRPEDIRISHTKARIHGDIA